MYTKCISYKSKTTIRVLGNCKNLDHLTLISNFEAEMKELIAQKKAYLNTTIPKDLLKSLKVLAAQEGVRINYLLKEAIQDILRKYDKKH